jgi:phenylalanyl-tRNA synthetase beta chain
LLINLLKNVKNNLAYYSDIKIFEIGNVFNKDEYKDKIYDVINLRLSGVIAHKTSKDMFYEAKGITDYLLKSFGIADYFYKDIDLKSNIWKRNAMAKIELDGIDIGYVGIPQKNVLDKMGINCQDIAIFDFDFDKLCQLATQEYEYQDIPKYPAVIRDIAVMVPINTKIDDVLQKINLVESDLIEDVDLFDIFEKDGNKSLAFHIIFQSTQKTLTGQEIDPIIQKIIDILSQNKDWKPRI